MFRKYLPKDRDALIHLWTSVFDDSAKHNDPAKMIDDKLEIDDLLFVLEHEGVLVSACIAGYDGHRGWLYSVATLPTYRRHGFAKTVVTSTIQALRQLGCGKVNLQIRGSNTSVKSFYESLGFCVEDRLSMSIFTTE